MIRTLSEMAEAAEQIGLAWIEAGSRAAVARNLVRDDRNLLDGKVFELRKAFEDQIRALAHMAKAVEREARDDWGTTSEDVASTAIDGAIHASITLGLNSGKTIFMLAEAIRMLVRADTWEEVCALADTYASCRGSLSSDFAGRFLAVTGDVNGQFSDAREVLRQNAAGRRL